MKIITHSEKETIELGKKLARELHGGEVIALYGDLGSGKTTLVKGIAQGLGIKKIITSPTFILMNVYKITNYELPFGHELLSTPPSALRAQALNGSSRPRGKAERRITNFVHIDCYRIHSAHDIENIGAQEYFGRKDSVVVVEWPEKIKSILPKRKLEITITSREKNKRIFEMY